MMMNSFLNCKAAGIILASILLFSSSCKPEENRISLRKGPDSCHIEAKAIRISLTQEGQISILNKENGISFTDAVGQAQSGSFFLIDEAGDSILFTLDIQHQEIKPLHTNFGKGKVITFHGKARKTSSRFTQTLSFEFYESFPHAVIVYAGYKNNHDSAVIINGITSNALTLNASKSDITKKPWEFEMFQGTSDEWGKDYIFSLPGNYRSENNIGFQEDTKYGGGVPVMDFWTKKGGIAIAHLSPTPMQVSFPSHVRQDEKVEISMSEYTAQKIMPGEDIMGLKSAIILHQSDFFNALKQYAQLMEAQGLIMKKYSNEAYEPIWCSWGYRSDFSSKELFNTLPKIKELGINWVVIDDRWFDKYGDWNPRSDTYPRGEADLRAMVDSLHQLGFKVKIWWDPPTFQANESVSWLSVEAGLSEVAISNPEWLIMNEDGEFATDARGMYIPCPSVPEVQQYFKDLCTRFIREWDFDGHKLDAYYTVPNCYNPAHNHKNPMESHQDFPKIIEIIQETTKSIKPYGITEICNCGVPQDIWQLAYVDQPVTSDPVGSGQVRQRVKMFKALMGANAPAYADHVELTAGEMAEGIYIHDGRDFASAVGTGAVIGTKFTWPADPDVDKNPFLLTREKEAHWKKWIDLYMEQMLSKKEYLNLYDIAFDVPETHVIQDRDTLFYAFYAENWQGKVELRGLSDQKYIVVDYVNNMVLGHINGNAPTLDIAFSDYLLIKASPLSHKQFHLRLRNHH